MAKVTRAQIWRERLNGGLGLSGCDEFQFTVLFPCGVDCKCITNRSVGIRLMWSGIYVGVWALLVWQLIYPRVIDVYYLEMPSFCHKSDVTVFLEDGNELSPSAEYHKLMYSACAPLPPACNARHLVIDFVHAMMSIGLQWWLGKVILRDIYRTIYRLIYGGAPAPVAPQPQGQLRTPLLGTPVMLRVKPARQLQCTPRLPSICNQITDWDLADAHQIKQHLSPGQLAWGVGNLRDPACTICTNSMRPLTGNGNTHPDRFPIMLHAHTLIPSASSSTGSRGPGRGPWMSPHMICNQCFDLHRMTQCPECRQTLDLQNAKKVWIA